MVVTAAAVVAQGRRPSWRCSSTAIDSGAPLQLTEYRLWLIPGAVVMEGEDSIYTQILTIYAVHNPEKLGMIDELLEEWRGEEEQLLANIKDKCVRETTSAH